ncbi:MAG: proton-conducting transporter membrane subunit [Candidatus Sericytochromatia bacterium]
MLKLLPILTSGLLLIPLLMFVFSVFKRIKHTANYSRPLTLAASVSQVLLLGLAAFIYGWVALKGPVEANLFSWFHHAQEVYSLTLYLDVYSGVFLLLTTFISAVIGRFSLNYLAHEEGYYKFFINFYLMQLALYCLIISSNFYFILISWELLGLASVFLISFYQKSKKTVSNALFVLGIYKFCDLFLILALLSFHHEQHDFLITAPAHAVSGLFLGLLVVASMGKSALFPFSKWVPRAMEGPTTSSAIFYGALSIHAGVLLLMKFRHLFAERPALNAFLFVLGALTVVYASLKSRIQTDAKSTLAYATVVQVGFIYLELALGLYDLVVFHTVSNALLKTYQFVRTPSNIHHFHHLEKLNQQRFGANGVHFEKLLPKAVRIWAYKLIYHNFGLTLLWQTLLAPLQSLQSHLHSQVCRLSAYARQGWVFQSQTLLLATGLLGVMGIGQLEQYGLLNQHYVAGALLLAALLCVLISLKHSTISDYLTQIKLSYFLVSASAVLFFGGRFHYDASFYFVSNLVSLLILDQFIKRISNRLDLDDIRSYLGIGNRYKYINMIAIAILLLLTFTPGFASFVIFDVVLEDMSEKSRLIMLLFLTANTLNIYSVFKFMFKIVFGESPRRLHEYPDFSRRELLRLSALILPMVAVGLLPFVIFH